MSSSTGEPVAGSPPPASPVGEVARLLVPVEDVEDAVKFYVDVLGYTLEFRDPGRYAAMHSGSMSVALAAAAEAMGMREPSFMIKVPDVDAAIKRLAHSGATVERSAVRGQHEVRAVVRPAQGGPLVLYSPQRPAAPESRPDDGRDESARSKSSEEADRSPQARLDPDVFRSVMGHFASGVTVITVRHDERDYGLTANAVSSLSLEPPMLVVCLNLQSGSQRAVAAQRSFVVNILDEQQSTLAARFAQRRSDKFADVPVYDGVLGHPVLGGVLAHLECRVVEDLVVGTHRVFLAEVVRAEARHGSPLAYFRGTFGRFALAQDDETHDRLRRLVLSRELPLDERLVLAALAARLDVPVSAIQYALTRLVGEGLVVRDPERGYVQRALDAETADAAFAAKLVIDLGVADMVNGRVSEQRLEQLRQIARAAASLVKNGRVINAEHYIKASVAFQECMIGLAENPLLVEAYRRLSIAEIVAPALVHHSHSREQLVEGRQRLIDAYAQGDIEAIRSTIMHQYELACQAQRAAIAHAGGRL